MHERIQRVIGETSIYRDEFRLTVGIRARHYRRRDVTEISSARKDASRNVCTGVSRRVQ